MCLVERKAEIGDSTLTPLYYTTNRLICKYPKCTNARVKIFSVEEHGVR